MSETPETRGRGLQNILGDSPAIRKAVELAQKVASRGPDPVLLTGQTGTGRELFARSIHYAGPNAEAPFVTVNCSTVPEEFLDSDLFGHETGALATSDAVKLGLVEVAGTGTLFIDEISDLPAALQLKLLRVLEAGLSRRIDGTEEIPVSCRIVAASNRPLEDEADAGRFHEEVFQRLNVYRIELPPLRERGRDIELLAHHFLESLAAGYGEEPKALSPSSLLALYSHSWPGNVRELKHAVQRAIVSCDEPIIEPEHLTIQVRWTRPVLLADIDENGEGEKAAQPADYPDPHLDERDEGPPEDNDAGFAEPTREPDEDVEELVPEDALKILDPDENLD